MFLELKKITFQNFLSYGSKPTVIEFQKGLNLVTGLNGVGKSASILDSISFCLFGKPYRDIKILELINRKNRKGLVVECEFEIDHTTTYLVTRSLKPDALYITKNGLEIDLLSSKKLNQDEIDKILGINYELFKQVISLSINHNKPFLSLSLQEKRNIIEQIFSIVVFGQMLKILKKKNCDEKIQFDLTRNTIKLLEENIKSLRKRLSEAKIATENFSKDKEKDLENITERINQYESEKQTILNKISTIEIPDNTEDENKLQALNIALENIIKSLSKLEYNTKIKNNKEKDLEKLNKRIEDKNSEKQLILSNIELIVFDDKPIDKLELTNLNTELESIIKDLSTNEYDVKLAKNKISFINKNKDICSECGQAITEEHKKQELQKYNDKINIATIEITKLNDSKKLVQNKITELKNQIKEAEDNKNEIKNLNDKLEYIEKEIINLSKQKDDIEKIEIDNSKDDELSLNTSKEDIQLQINELNKKIKDTDNKKSEKKSLNDKIGYIDKEIIHSYKQKDDISDRKMELDVDSIQNEFDIKVLEYKSISKKESELEEKLKINKISSDILSESGIKSFFLKKLIPVLNNKINEYIRLFEIPIIFSFDEQMNEKIVSGDCTYREITYNSFSEGEKKRLDFAVLFSFIDIQKMISNWNCNILTIDEMLDSSVDSNGLDKLLESIKRMIRETNNNLSIFIISHRINNSEFDDIFDRKIEIKKGVNNFSHIEVL